MTTDIYSCRFGCRKGQDTGVLRSIALTDFRGFGQAELDPVHDGTTVLVGPNGSGKTTVLEAVALLSSQRSFRGAPRDALIRHGAERAYVRGEVMMGERRLTVELELARRGVPSRIQVNRQSASRAVLAETFPCTVFSPDDLNIIQGPPAARRRFLDDALVFVDRSGATTVDDVERALRQRGALLRQAAGRWSAEIERSLDVWDARLSGSGEALAKARSRLVEELVPLVVRAYRALAGENKLREVFLHYEPSWSGGYAEALFQARHEDLRRATTTVGPHRDDLVVQLNGRDARFESSQGEQRCLALSLRLAVHQLLTDRTGHPPVLLLDDVFSELDPARTNALIHELPVGQCLVTTALPVPAAMDVAAVLDVRSLSR